MRIAAEIDHQRETGQHVRVWAGLSSPSATSSSAPLCSEASFEVSSMLNADPIEVNGSFSPVSATIMQGCQ